ncbi:hypothetical protein DWQ65_05810 [Treponema phagedenis]|uniref:Uncharacterized protein n=1 Tax=Treponema phagedenis TaxID=162 RepID=A0A0B7GXH8_TREPH|nr:hypothetical protein [Treponema phagedenis]EFW37180.1 hypothetical protein HMPREF9554_02342 [Treponema phagedenis F0421]NVP24599.1 hypothetical protein [Treponema phagedenis]QEJ94708.1 hypothetical protein FUT79_05465 [Treponema phagedenis]QEJ97644.1 hypothetical protein FUT82_06315 [Treponema phagedenis]QEK00612.1 hypothetical protein FUT84_05150 [Treponema phagedenis]
MKDDIFDTLGEIFGLALNEFVSTEMQKEYDAIVAENTKLKDFINEHDFYKKQKNSVTIKTAQGTEEITYRTADDTKPKADTAGTNVDWTSYKKNNSINFDV